MKWDAELYDQKHAFVFQYGESVLELLDVKAHERILDLGCGTGYLTHQIKDKGADVIGMDASADMIRQAKVSYPDVNFTVADGANFYFGEPFDAVFSNATLHWIHDADAVMDCVYKSLKPGGRFVAELGGKGNMAHLIAATSKVLTKYGFDDLANTKLWYFPSLGEYTAKLEAHGFRVTFAAHFDRKTALQDGRLGVSKWLDMFASSYFNGIESDTQSRIKAEITDLLQPHYEDNGEWYADYVRLRFTAIKETGVV
jgi:trans-aconitate methyltransferase